MNKTASIFLFCILTTILGFIAGSAVWFVLHLINLGTDALWTYLPQAMGIGHSLPYFLAVCLLGGLLIGLWQRQFGLLPDNMEEVIGKIKANGTYSYNRLHIIAVAAILPLIFGGALGPEAGLTGLVAGLCCCIGDRLKYKGDQVAALTEAGFAATLGVIFHAPLFGIVHQLEPDNREEHYRQKLVSKKTRIIIYCCGVLGAMVAFALLNSSLGGSGGLPRFGFEHAIGLKQWMWFIPLLALGIVAALYYQVIARFTRFLRGKLGDRPIISCLIAGAVVAVCGYLVPLSMFSGEHQLETLIYGWENMTIPVMVLSAAVKLFLINACISFGWKGGNIFPIIYSAALLGYSFALLTGMDGAFAVAILTASLYAYIMRKPVTVVAVLLLCFPVTYILPLLVSAFVASRIPSPFAPKGKGDAGAGGDAAPSV